MFYIIVDKNDIVSVVFVEIDYVYYNVELMDCVIFFVYWKYGFMKYLLNVLEVELK